jgi:hypothetical protein
MPSPGEIVAYLTLTALQGALVVMPRPGHSARWTRLRSPGWALVLPGALIVGTFGVLDAPGLAGALVTLAALGTPVLVALAVVGVLRGSRLVWFAGAGVFGAAVLTLHSWPGQLAASVLTALGCLTLGAALVRLTPLPWLAAAIATMCVLDVAFLGTGVGQPAAARLNEALAQSSLPDFHQAMLGGVKKDYPDLVLAGVLGNTLAGHARQRTAAVLVAVLVSVNGLFFLVADMLPGTVPVAVAAVTIALLERRASGSRSRSTARRTRGRVRPAPTLAPSTSHG